VNIRRSLPLLIAPLLVLTAGACGDDDDATGSTDAVTVPTVASDDTEGTTADDATASTTASTEEDTATTDAGATSGSGATPAGDDTGGTIGPITVGSANFPESQLLAQIYGQAIAEVGYDVSYELGIGSREVYYSAIESGEVGLVPEYTNSLLSFVVKKADPNATVEAANVDEQIEALEAALPDELQVLTPSEAEDKDVIVCTAEAAEEHGLTNLSDLGANSADITLGAPPEFETRSPFGLVGFQDIYGATEFADFIPLDPGAVGDALSAGQIDCGNLFSTDPIITTSGWVALDDDKGTVPNEAVLPLVRSEFVTPELVAALDEVNGALDTEGLKALVVKVTTDAEAPDVVAKEWLDSL
jgi:osmoprotectant transport system substrate-binding protein